MKSKFYMFLSVILILLCDSKIGAAVSDEEFNKILNELPGSWDAPLRIAKSGHPRAEEVLLELKQWDKPNVTWKEFTEENGYPDPTYETPIHFRDKFLLPALALVNDQDTLTTLCYAVLAEYNMVDRKNLRELRALKMLLSVDNDIAVAIIASQLSDYERMTDDNLMYWNCWCVWALSRMSSVIDPPTEAKRWTTTSPTEFREDVEKWIDWWNKYEKQYRMPRYLENIFPTKKENDPKSTD